MKLHCDSCGLDWKVQPRPDGGMPETSRCPRSQGGCGKLRRVPRRPVPGTAARSPGWDPPSQPRQPRQAGEECPQCSGPLTASPRGTVRVCTACRSRVTPAAVLAPYRRGTGVTRAARSQRERDDDAKKTVLMAGEFLRQVRAMLGDAQLHPASADLLGWYEEEIGEARKARDGGRLAELAGEFAADREARAFRRRRWWQGQPPVVAGIIEDEDDEDQDDDGEPGAVVPATPASIAARPHRALQPQKMTWADAMASLGWRMSPAAGGGCQVIGEHGRPCGRETAHHTGGGWLCAGCRDALAAVITNDYYRRSL